jgi:nucleoside-diphosphate-sugar epimerase
MDYTDLIIYDDKFSDGQYKKTADNSRFIEKHGDYKFTEIGDGIKKTVDWFLLNYRKLICEIPI